MVACLVVSILLSVFVYLKSNSEKKMLVWWLFCMKKRVKSNVDIF